MPRPRARPVEARERPPEVRNLTITNGAFVAFSVCLVMLIAVAAFLVYQDWQLGNERGERRRQVNEAFLLNCMNREREIGQLRRKLGLPPTRVKCTSLPVFGK